MIALATQRLNVWRLSNTGVVETRLQGMCWRKKVDFRGDGIMFVFYPRLPHMCFFWMLLLHMVFSTPIHEILSPLKHSLSPTTLLPGVQYNQLASVFGARGYHAASVEELKTHLATMMKYTKSLPQLLNVEILPSSMRKAQVSTCLKFCSGVTREVLPCPNYTPLVYRWLIESLSIQWQYFYSNTQLQLFSLRTKSMI